MPRRVGGRQLGLQRLNVGVFFGGFGLQRMSQLGLGQLGCRLAAVARPLLLGLQLFGQRVALFAHRAQSLRHRQLARHLARVELGFQRLNLRVFGRRCVLQRMGDIGLGQGNRVALFPLGQLQPLMQLFFKIAIAHLLEDVGVPRLVDLEGFVAVGADDFVHVAGALVVGRVGRWMSIPVQFKKVVGRVALPPRGAPKRNERTKYAVIRTTGIAQACFATPLLSWPKPSQNSSENSAVTI